MLSLSWAGTSNPGSCRACKTPDSVPYYCSRPFPTASRTIARVPSTDLKDVDAEGVTPIYKTRTPKASEGPFRTASRTIARVFNTNCSFSFPTASRTIARVLSTDLKDVDAEGVTYYCSLSQRRLLPSIPDSVTYYCSRPFPKASRTIVCVPNTEL